MCLYLSNKFVALRWITGWVNVIMGFLVNGIVKLGTFFPSCLIFYGTKKN